MKALLFRHVRSSLFHLFSFVAEKHNDFTLHNKIFTVIQNKNHD